MKIENIIQDIIQDTVDIKNVLALQLQKEKPMVDFIITLPGVEKLSAIKVVELRFEEQQVSYTLRAEIHTQNGYRVFEMESWHIGGDIKDMAYDSLQKWFINLLRVVIKKVKRLKKSGQFDQCVNLIN
ncbi:MAG: hypothetical protein ABJB11_02295 [Ferruginibacter sp.]